MARIIDVHEGIDRHGGYILMAGGHTFQTFDQIVAAFPGAQLAFHPKPPYRPRHTMARDVDFPLFE